MSDKLFLLRGGILSFVTIALSLKGYISTYNEYGTDYLKEDETISVICSLAAFPIYLTTKHKLSYMILDSNALASFLSLTVRYYGNQHEQLSTNNIPYIMMLTIPVALGSSYVAIKYNNYVLRSIILLTPVIIEHILSWIIG
ncbi:hypothetical protein [Endozoicomonas euniceicola]|uniref:Uncharacterized protein n=1 Tax=Endozoicomonas euniceicola TaxID=1234143 RepID=A0ABY6GW23_9GAMM|nr:hypothetical protein [Endozoicomonas euniceicola]UYM16964.1 hypothetical protein NX720_03300 [Endozoicomonas euniceicola]